MKKLSRIKFIWRDKNALEITLSAQDYDFSYKMMPFQF